jgi:hypothetical protein
MLAPMSKRLATVDEIVVAIEAAREKVMADEVKSLTKLGIPKAMAYQVVANRFHQNGTSPDEAEPDFESAQGTAWEEIG